jgi:hypothetical protein
VIVPIVTVLTVIVLIVTVLIVIVIGRISVTGTPARVPAARPPHSTGAWVRKHADSCPRHADATRVRTAGFLMTAT